MLSIFKLLLIAALFNGLSWIILIPIWQYPDEQAHFAQVQDVAELGERPVDKLNTSLEIVLSEENLGTERDETGNNKFTYHPQYKLDYSDNYFGPQENFISGLPKSTRTQLVKNEATLNPPLYYLLGSLFYKLFDDGSLFDRVYAVRLMSLFFFLITVIVSFKIGQLIFPKNKTLPIVITGLIAFMPMFIFASTGVLPDSLTNLLFTLVLFLGLKIFKEDFDFKRIISMLFFIVLGVLTRQQFLVAVLVIFPMLIYRLFKKPPYFRKTVLFSASSLVFICFIYFTNIYGTTLPIISDFRIPDLSIFYTNAFSNLKFTDHFLWTIRHMISEVLPWYWGVYRWLSFTLPPFYYQIINRIIIISTLGILIKFFLIIKKRKITQDDLLLSFMILASLIYFLVFLIWDYFFRASHGFSFGIQGRYFFPLIVFQMAIFIIGIQLVLEIVLKRYLKYGLYIILLLIILANDFSLSYLSTSYYDTSNLTIFIKQVSQYKPQILKGYFLLLPLFMTIFLQVIFLFSFAKHIMRENKQSFSTNK